MIPKAIRSVDDYRLADLPVGVGRFRMLGRESARRPLAMHPHTPRPVADRVGLELGNVVGDIIQQA